MKKMILSCVVLMTSLLFFSLRAQNNNGPVALGLPGDNLNLYAVLEVFQKSPTLEAFERELNKRENNINNLDLNNDNAVDYIEVVSHKEGDSHSIVLRVAISYNEYQDVAVLEVHRNQSGKVIVQIIGDVDLYGKNYIIEPSSEKKVAETPNPGYTGDESVTINYYNSTGNGVYYVNDWPIIVTLFSPVFSVYISPWHWGFYPSYWVPWTPIRYYSYWNYHDHYYRNHFYRRAPFIRYPVPYSYYSKQRNSSPTVIRNSRNGNYGRTYEGRSYRKPDGPMESPRATTRPALPPERSIVPPVRQVNPPISPSQRGAPVKSMPTPAQKLPPSRTIEPPVQQGNPPVKPVTPPARQLPPTRTILPPSRQVTPSERPVPAPNARPSGRN